jgi:hypothetical protein
MIENLCSITVQKQHTICSLVARALTMVLLDYLDIGIRLIPIDNTMAMNRVDYMPKTRLTSSDKPICVELLFYLKEAVC